jgi:uncharacterized membrane protein YvlD (DUF360 family)
MHAVKSVSQALYRFATLWIADSLSLLVTAAVIPNITLTSVDTTPRFVVAVAAAFLLGLVNFLIRPLVLLLALPLGFFAVFGVGFLINAVTLKITANLLPGLDVNTWLAALIGGIVFAAINVVLTNIMAMNDEGSIYQGLIERLARRQPFKSADEPGRGLVMLEIDGLSHHHLQKALADGRLPTMSAMMREEGYVVSPIDCGIPSQTSSCQAGIMFGDNTDIPAFRWFDKDQNKLFVSGKDAAEINARYAKGNGLMRGGSSIDNMMNGDAEKSLLTVADLKTDDKVQQKRRADDIYLLMLNPYFLTRTIALFLGEVVREVWQGQRQRMQNVQPRLNRLAHGYPFIRAATTVFVRDISANLAILDILRGAPSIYVTWPGYDEVAHHSGPWTSDAFGALAKYDHVIARVRRVIKEQAPRQYDLIILSDHGQSFGATFKQRYGFSLKEFIEQHLPQGTTVAQAMGGDDGGVSMTAMSGELDNLSQQGEGGAVGRTVIKQGQKALQKAEEERGVGAEPASAAQVTAYGSGNLAQVYFDLHPRKILLSELETAYPGMVDALVQHEGIGFVVGYGEGGTPMVLGKGGQRNLHTGEVVGEDPLKPYGDPELRSWQVRYVADFPHAGDLMVNSTVFADGTVAALEELIGCHGGMGGEQTDSFLFHPPDMVVPATRNSTDVFHILNARRGSPVTEPVARQDEVGTGEVSAWAPANLAKGLAEFHVWLGRAARAVILEHSAFREVARDPYMTGPAVLIGLLGALAAAVFAPGGWQPGLWLGRIGIFLLAVLVTFGAGRILSGQGQYTTTLRPLGFAMTAHVFQLLAIVPPLAPFARLVSTLVLFMAAWVGAAEAHNTRGWRTFVLPLVTVGVLVVGLVVLRVLFAGATFTMDALATEVGLRAP